MTEDQRRSCHAIIHGASTAAAGIGAGLAQIPLSDSAIILPIQVTMIVSLGAVFDVHVTDGVAKGIALGMAASFVGRAASQIFFGWMPVLGNVINAATAAGITEAMGWAIVDKFNKGEIGA